MAGIFFSFLGTSPYLECCYALENSHSGGKDQNCRPVRFVQEYLIEKFCSTWGEQDRIVIFTTAEASNKNWYDNGHGDGAQGLQSRLQTLKLKASCRKVDIPEGQTEAQIWEIFAAILNCIQERDEVVFDITHAFRSIPLLAIVVLNYAKVVHKVKLKGIYYGAFEALGLPAVVRKQIPDPCNRVAPVLDLTRLDNLLDWSFAVDKLLKAGDATGVQALAGSSVRELLVQSQGKDSDAAAIRGLGVTLQKFTQAMATCRAREIGQLADNLKNRLQQCAQSRIITPLKPLIGQIRNEVDAFGRSPVSDGIQAAKWCRRHNLTQQAITILHETLTTWCLQDINEEADPYNVELRNAASSALEFANRNVPEKEWKGDAQKHRELTRRMVYKIKEKPAVAKASTKLRSLRNDINHAGTNPSACEADQFTRQLTEVFDLLRELDLS